MTIESRISQLNIFHKGTTQFRIITDIPPLDKTVRRNLGHDPVRHRRFVARDMWKPLAR